MTSTPLPIALVGLRAVGKSALAQRLARRLGRSAVDTDAEIVRLAVERRQVGTSADTGEVLRALGEPAFRKLEEEALTDAVRQPNTVVATGGGAVEREQARTILRTRTIAVWLDAPIELLARRMREDAVDRPALFGRDAIAELPQLAARRTAWLAEVARVRVKVGSLDVDGALAAVLDALAPHLDSKAR